MSFQIVKKGVRSSESKVYISKDRNMALSAGFFRNNKISLIEDCYIRLAYDSSSKEIAFEISNLRKNDDEYLKLTIVQSKTSAFCSIRPITSTFSLEIEDLKGSYIEGKSLIGPVKIDGFSDRGFILKTHDREN